jgi:hypothetical protein
MAKQNCMTIIKEKPEIPFMVNHALLDAVGPIGEIVRLLSTTHKASGETLLLLNKMREFWKLVEESLVICPRESLQ